LFCTLRNSARSLSYDTLWQSIIVIWYHTIVYCVASFYFQPDLSLTHRHVCIHTFLLITHINYMILHPTKSCQTNLTHTHTYAHTNTPSRTCIASPVCLCNTATRKSAWYTRKRDLRFPKKQEKIAVNSQLTKQWLWNSWKPPWTSLISIFIVKKNGGVVMSGLQK